MNSTGIGPALIEKYLRMRGFRRYRADDGECMIAVASDAGAFRFYLRPSTSAEVVKVRARSDRRLPGEQRARLLEVANRFNDHNQWLTASVREGTDAGYLRVVGNSRFWVTDGTDLDTFARFVDMSLASAAALFEAVDAELQLPTPEQLQRWFDWK